MSESPTASGRGARLVTCARLASEWPPSALILSYILLGEFRWMHLLGFAVVPAGVLPISREHPRTEKES